jgi:HK97 family phage portal protein
MAAMQECMVQRKLVKKSGVTMENVSPTHPLVELLEEVNPQDTKWDLWFHMVGWRLLTGDSFLYKAKNGFGIPKEIWPMPTQWVRVIPDARTYISGYEIQSGPASYIVPRDWMVHVKNPNLDWSDVGRYYGQPSIQACATTIELENEMFRRLYHQFRNFSAPGMVFHTDTRLQPHQVRQIWAQMTAQHSMAEHSGRPMVLHSGLNLSTAYSHSSNKELAYSESLDKTLEYTMAVMGVPPAVVGLTKANNRANMDSALTQFCKMTVDPILRHMSEHLTQDLARDFSKDLVIKLGPCMVDTEENMRKDIEVMIKAGAVTPDEVRKMLQDMPNIKSAHGDRPVMVSGFGLVDPKTGSPEVPQAPGTSQAAAPANGAKAARNGKAPKDESGPNVVGRMALAGKA